MTRKTTKFYCSLCDREFKDQSIFGQDLHIRHYHSAKLIDEAVKKYTKVVLIDE